MYKSRTTLNQAFTSEGAIWCFKDPCDYEDSVYANVSRYQTDLMKSMTIFSSQTLDLKVDPESARWQLLAKSRQSLLKLIGQLNTPKVSSELGTQRNRFFEALGTFLSSDIFTQARVMQLVITLVRNAVIDP